MLLFFFKCKVMCSEELLAVCPYAPSVFLENICFLITSMINMHVFRPVNIICAYVDCFVSLGDGGGKPKRIGE